MPSSLRDAACQYAAWNWAVHPLWPRSKKPATANGKNDATSDLGQVFRWWRSCPSFNIGINCERSGLVVIDVDPRNGGEDTLWELEQELGGLPWTPTTNTGGGGWHHLFRHPDVPLRGSLGHGVDVKDAGYVVAPPSVHPCGKRYEWCLDGDPEYDAVIDLPPSWLARMTRQTHVSGPLTRSDAPLLQIPSVEYVRVLTGRIAQDGWVKCPWHAGGQERTASMKLTETTWACFACEPLPGKNVCGGNIVSFAGKLWGFAMPLVGSDLAEVMDRLNATFEPC